MTNAGPPPKIEQIGNLVTLHADLALIEGNVPSEFKLIDGTALASQNLYASSDGVRPIVFTLPPGTYAVKAYGYPLDRMTPVRATSVFSVSVLEPDRIQKLAKLLLEFSQRLYQFESVKSEILSMSPTKDELRQVLDTE